MCYHPNCQIGSVFALAFCVAISCGCSGTQLVPNHFWGFDKQERTSHRTPASRIEALHELAAQGPTASIDQKQEVAISLTSHIQQESDPVIREQIVRTLVHYDTPTAAAVQRAALQDDDPNVRVAACQALAARGGSDALQNLAERLDIDSDLDVRLAAAKALARFREPAAVQALAHALEDQDPALQRRAVLSLEKVTGRDLGPDVNAWRQLVREGNVAPAEKPSWTEQLRKLSPF